MVMGLILVLVSGLASPAIFAPSLAVGWFARRWWQVLLGAVAVALLSQAEVLLIELPDATPDWAYEPLGLIAPVAWCAAGFLLHSWYRRASLRRSRSSMRALPVVIGMVLGALVVGGLALGVGLLYLRTGQLEFHTVHTGGTTGSADHETVFFQYLFPGLLLGQLAGGLIGRVLGRPLMPAQA